MNHVYSTIALVLFLGIALLGSIADAAFTTDGHFWRQDNESKILAPVNNTMNICIGANCWVGYDLSIEHNASIGGSPICTQDNELCSAGSGDNASWNQGLATTLFYPRNANPNGYYNSTTLPGGSGDNSSFNETLTTTLYYPRNTNPAGFYNSTTLPAYPTAENTSWNETRGNALYYSITNPSGFITGYAESDPIANPKFSSLPNLTYAQISNNIGNWSNVATNYYTATQINTLGNWSLDKPNYVTLTQLNAGANLTYALVASNIGNFSANGYTRTYIDTLGNASKHVATCGVNTVVQNITATGIQCVTASSGSGDNSSWNQSLGDTLYYPRNTNPLGFYNITTLPTYPTADNTSWNESRANSLYTTPSYVASAVGQNLTYALITTVNGNWSADKPSYATLAQLNSGVGQNLTYALINTNMGNWSKDKSTLPNLTYAQIATSIGNWSADKPSYATLTQLNAGANLTYALVASNIGNFSANGYTRTYIDTLGNASKHIAACGVNTVVQNITATGIQCVAASSGGDNSSWNQSLADSLYWRNNSPSLRVNGTLSNFTVPALYIHQNYTNSTNAYRTLLINITTTAAPYFASAPLAYYKNGELLAGISFGGGLFAESISILNAGFNNIAPATEEYITLKSIVDTPAVYVYSGTNPADAVHLNISTGTSSNDVFLESQGETNSGLRLLTKGTGKVNVSGAFVAANISLQTNCANGEILKWSGGVGKCGTDDGGVGSGDNSSWNESLATSLYYPLSNNPNGYYNVSTFPFNSKIVTVENQTVTGTTLANITGFIWQLAPNSNYSLDCNLYFSSNTTTNGLSLALEDWGSKVTRVIGGSIITGVSATTTNAGTYRAMAGKVTSTAVLAVNTVYPATFTATIWNGANAVNITPQFSAEVASQNTTIVKGSICNMNII